MPLSYLMAVAMIKVIPTVMVRLSNTNLYKRLVVFGLNLGMRKNAFLQEELGFISNMFWAEQLRKSELMVIQNVDLCRSVEA